MKSFKSYLKEYGALDPFQPMGGSSSGPGMGQYVPTADLNLRASNNKKQTNSSSIVVASETSLCRFRRGRSIEGNRLPHHGQWLGRMSLANLLCSWSMCSGPSTRLHHPWCRSEDRDERIPKAVSKPTGEL